MTAPIACRCRGPEPGACGPEVEAPTGGAAKWYRIDSIELPRRSSDFADDLDGDGRPDNQLGNLVALAAAAGYEPSRSARTMLAAGALSPRVEVATQNGRAAIRWHADAGGEGTLFAARVDADGAMRSDRIRCVSRRIPTRIRLPLLPDADPVALTLEAAEIDLSSAAEGLTGVLRGAALPAGYEEATHRALATMLRSRPAEHRVALRLLDRDGDAKVSMDELRASPVFGSFALPDLRLGGASKPVALSVAFAFHAKECGTPECTATALYPSCDDRIRNGAESDVDCGGECPSCAGGAACRAGADCQSGLCPALACAEPTCDDGRRDASESDLDCGGACRPCADGGACRDGDDCAGRCAAGVCAACRTDGDCRRLFRTTCSAGRCVAPSCSNGRRDGRESDADCGGGDCAACEDGRACRDEADCTGGECENFRCRERGEEEDE